MAEPEFFKIQWMKIINKIIKDASSKKNEKFWRLVVVLDFYL